MNEKLLKKLYSINSPSGKETDMENFVIEFVSGISGVNFWSDKRGNIYAEKRGSEIGSEFPCIVATWTKSIQILAAIIQHSVLVAFCSV